MEKWNPTQEAINKALRPNTIRKWLNTILIVIAGVGIIILIIYFGSKKSADNSTIEKNTTENKLNPKTPELHKQSDTPSQNDEVSEDFSSYINTSITNSSSKTNIAVTIIDENGSISSTISSSIANIYNQAGNNGNTGLIRSTFIHKSGFQELLEGNSEIIDKLNLKTHTDYVAIGKISYSIRKGALIDDTYVCTVSLTMNIISASQKSLAKSFTCSANGNGATEDQAKEYAIDKLLNKYSSECSPI